MTIILIAPIILIMIIMVVFFSTTLTTPCGVQCTGAMPLVQTFFTGSTSLLPFILVSSFINKDIIITLLFWVFQFLKREVKKDLIVLNIFCLFDILHIFPIFLTMYPRKTPWVQYFPAALWGTLPTQQVLQSSSLSLFPTSISYLVILALKPMCLQSFFCFKKVGPLKRALCHW